MPLDQVKPLAAFLECPACGVGAPALAWLRGTAQQRDLARAAARFARRELNHATRVLEQTGNGDVRKFA